MSELSQEIMESLFHSRKLLFHNPFNQSTEEIPSTPESGGLNGNVLMVLSVLLCGIICSLALHYVVRCALRCSSGLLITDNNSNTSPSLPSASVVNTGVSKKVLMSFAVVSYSTEAERKIAGSGTECVICLSEFESEEKLRVLPNCGHAFHVCCIDKWLKSHSSCPKCRHCLLHTCEKIPECVRIVPPSQHQGGGISVQTETS